MQKFFKDTALLIIRQSGVFAFFAFLFALCQALYVATALCHGVGLHGAYLETTGLKPAVLIPVWSTFLQAVTAGCISLVFFLIAVHTRKRRRLNIYVLSRHDKENSRYVGRH